MIESGSDRETPSSREVYKPPGDDFQPLRVLFQSSGVVSQWFGEVSGSSRVVYVFLKVVYEPFREDF